MKLKCLLAAVMLFGATSATFAQSEDSEEKIMQQYLIILLTKNMVSVARRMTLKIDFNFGWFVSKSGIGMAILIAVCLVVAFL